MKKQINNQLYSLLLGLIILAFGLQSCASIEDPSVKSIEDVEILKANKDVVELNAVMVIYNPNPFALDLDQADMVASIEEVEVAQIQQTYESKMPAQAEFRMPIYLNMDIQKIYEDNPLKAIGKGLQIISDRKVEVSLLGNIKAGKGLAKITVPIDRKEWIEF